MAAAMCNHAVRALFVDGALQRRAACGDLTRRRFLGLPRVKTVGSSNSVSLVVCILVAVLIDRAVHHPVRK